MIWLWILAGLAALVALSAWGWWGVLVSGFGTCEGDENAAQTHQIDAQGDFYG